MGLNKFDEEYHKYLINVLSHQTSNFRPAARTGSSTVGVFGQTMEFDCSEKTPLVTTKSVYTKGVLGELVMFLRGENNLKFLLDRKVHIWDGNGFDKYVKSLSKNHELKLIKKDTLEFDQALSAYITRVQHDSKFAEKHGSLGGVYGVQWRNWKGQNHESQRKLEDIIFGKSINEIKDSINEESVELIKNVLKGKSIDQMNNMLSGLKKNPFSRYHLVSAWNPGEISQMALPPCHMFFQLYHRVNDEGENTLDLLMFQRSCDSFLGVPFNIASYATKLQMIAQLTDHKPGIFKHVLGDAHVYCGVGDRSEWYAENFKTIKELIRNAKTPDEFREIQSFIFNNANKEPEGSEGSDHIPYILEQLTRQEYKEPPTLNYTGANINEIDISDLEYINYNPSGAITIKGIKPRMAI